MMGFSVDMGGVKAKLQKICTNKRLGSFLANEAASGMDQYVPYRTGALSQSVSTEPFRIHYGMKYAKYPYHGHNMTISKQKHPNATSEWDRAYAIAHGQELADAGTEFIKGL